jgi:hypothetical protein
MLLLPTNKHLRISVTVNDTVQGVQSPSVTAIRVAFVPAFETFAELSVKEAKPTSSSIFSYYQTLMDAVTLY